MKILKEGEYYGQQKKATALNGILLSEYDYQTQQTDWHYHENPYFMYLLQGQVYDVNKKVTTNCGAGTLLFHNWQEKHYNYKHSSKARGFHIEFKNKSLKELLHGTLNAEGSLHIKNPNAHILLARLYREFLESDHYSAVGIESLLIALCSQLETDLEQERTKPFWLKKLRDLIHENQVPTSLKELSKILNVHPVHISRTFSQRFACTLSEYIRMIKVQKAIPYLLNKKHSLTEIAYLCDFADQSHFSRTFKKHMGRSPGNFKSIFKY